MYGEANLSVDESSDFEVEPTFWVPFIGCTLCIRCGPNTVMIVAIPDHLVHIARIKDAVEEDVWLSRLVELEALALREGIGVGILGLAITFFLHLWNLLIKFYVCAFILNLLFIWSTGNRGEGCWRERGCFFLSDYKDQSKSVLSVFGLEVTLLVGQVFWGFGLLGFEGFALGQFWVALHGLFTVDAVITMSALLAPYFLQ